MVKEKFTDTDRRRARGEIKRIYLSKRNKIISRVNDFDKIWENGTDKDIFAELVFCILIPQSNVKLCWEAVKSIVNRDLLLKGNSNRLLKELDRVRFKYKKAEYMVECRRHFKNNGSISIKSKIKKFSESFNAREWLVINVKGIGYKEASHFLRNIGFGEELAILDRHILRNLKYFRVIKEVPICLSAKKYLEIEECMKRFAGELDIPMSHLDLVLWYEEKEEIFK